MEHNGDALPKRDWDTVPAERRKKLVGRIYIEREVTTGLAHLINRVRAERQYLDEPSCILIVGETGTGKSAFLKRYAGASVARRLGGRTIRPTVLVELPVRATMQAAAAEILQKLGDPGARKGNLIDQTFRAKHLLLEESVEVVLIDEFQHIIEASGDRTLNKVGDWLKKLSKDTNIPFVLAGTGNSTGVIDANRQFAGICPYRFRLDGFSNATGEERRAFREFIARFDAELPFNQLSRIAEPKTSQALLLATNGNMRQLVRLLKTAALHAIDRAAPSIGMEDLSFGFRSIELISGLPHNPFDDAGAALLAAS